MIVVDVEWIFLVNFQFSILQKPPWNVKTTRCWVALTPFLAYLWIIHFPMKPDLLKGVNLSLIFKTFVVALIYVLAWKIGNGRRDGGGGGKWVEGIIVTSVANSAMSQFWKRFFKFVSFCWFYRRSRPTLMGVVG